MADAQSRESASQFWRVGAHMSVGAHRAPIRSSSGSVREQALTGQRLEPGRTGPPHQDREDR